MDSITQCRACDSTKLMDFLDLGEQYLSDFRRDGVLPPKRPLVVTFCEGCKLVQLRHSTPQDEMYHERYGFKSGVSDSIRNDLDSIVTHAFQYKNDPKSWLDIASNDGTLLAMVPKDVYRVGIDPIEPLCKEARPHADEIINEYFSDIYFYKKFDVVTSISCFYDMPDPRKFVSELSNILNAGGVWIIQQNYLLTTIQLNAVDNFCHEHLEYYTLCSLEGLLQHFDLEVNEVLLSPVNGGSIRTVVSRKGTFPVDGSVEKQRIIEQQFGAGNPLIYRVFANQVMVELDRLRAFVDSRIVMGKRIAILGASTRGATIWQSAGIGKEQICYAVERNSAKVGAEFCAIQVPIVSEEYFRKDRPDYAIVGPWFFANEITAREREYSYSGGRFIIPLPKLEVV